MRFGGETIVDIAFWVSHAKEASFKFETKLLIRFLRLKMILLQMTVLLSQEAISTNIEINITAVKKLITRENSATRVPRNALGRKPFRLKENIKQFSYLI